jgi:membrane dipeptidase
MRIIIFLVIATLLIGCKTTESTQTKEPLTPTLDMAKKLSQKYVIVDGHVDLPYRLAVSNFRLEKEYLGIPISTEKGDFDYVRSKEGGLDAPFMSIYIPASNQLEKGKSKKHAEMLIDMVEGISKEHPDKFEIANSVSDVRRIKRQGKVALPMGMENGAGLEDDIKNVQYFKDRGISYITLTHSKVNLICDSSYDPERKWVGLSPYGEKVVKEMNRVGIMVDISHVSDSTFYDVVRLTDVPVIASHSSAREYTPDFERNMSDDLIKALGENGGVIMINFGSSFLDQKSRDQADATRTMLRKMLKDMELEADSPKGKAVSERFMEGHPVLFSDVKKVADHIDHVVNLIGIDHVGLGSDFDGVGDSLPTGLKDVSDYPNLILELIRRGYSERDISKICSGNLFRVWQEVENYAKAN